MRVSRPSARIGFSEQMVVAPYQDGMSLQFRVVNRRRNDLMEIEARVLLMTVEEKDGQPAEFLAHKAKAVLADLTLNKTIALEYDRLRYDHYGRLLAYLWLPDHTLVNTELVRQGLARAGAVIGSPVNTRGFAA